MSCGFPPEMLHLTRQVCLEYLERYFMLIAFTAYLSGASFAPGEAQHRSFGQWLDERPELQRWMLFRTHASQISVRPTRLQGPQPSLLVNKS